MPQAGALLLAAGPLFAAASARPDGPVPRSEDRRLQDGQDDLGIPSRGAGRLAAGQQGSLNSAMAGRILGPPAPAAGEAVSRGADGRVTLRPSGSPSHSPWTECSTIRCTTRCRRRKGSYSRNPTRASRSRKRPASGCSTTRTASISPPTWSEEHPELLMANEMRRDQRNIDWGDSFSVILDTFYDRRNGFLFHTNALGALFDAQVTDERNTNSDWNTVWWVKSRLVEKRLHPGDPDPVPLAPLRRRRTPALGNQLPPPHQAQERAGVPDPDAPGVQPERTGAPLQCGDARGSRGAGRFAADGTEALRHRLPDARPAERPAERVVRRRRRRLQVRRHRRAHRRRHLEHRLRAGGGRRDAGQPEPVQPLLPGKARVLPRRPGGLRLWRPAGPGVRRRGWKRHPHPVLQPLDRDLGRERGADPGRRAPPRPRRRLPDGALEHPDRRSAGSRRGEHQLQRLPDEARHLLAVERRGDRDPPERDRRR